jgi:hypothetical protein
VAVVSFSETRLAVSPATTQTMPGETLYVKVAEKRAVRCILLGYLVLASEVLEGRGRP